MSPCPGKPFVPKNPTREIPREEQITLEPELEEALANATEAEMCDIAGGSCTGQPRCTTTLHEAAASHRGLAWGLAQGCCVTLEPRAGPLHRTTTLHKAAPQHRTGTVCPTAASRGGSTWHRSVALGGSILHREGARCIRISIV